MDVHRAWQNTGRLRHVLLCLFIAWHLFATFMNNLPWSPVVERFFDTYRPYLGYTGTVQDGWAMYSQVHTTDNHYLLTGVLPDGTERQLDYPGQTRPGMIANRPRDFLEERDATFLESLSDGPEDVQASFAAYLCHNNPDVSDVRFDVVSADIAPLAEWTAPAEISAYTTSAVFSYECAPAYRQAGFL